MLELLPQKAIGLTSSLFLTNVLLIYMIERSPRTKGTFIRPDDKGNNRFHFPSYLNFALSPLNITKPRLMLWFWRFRNLDINIPFFNLSIILAYYSLSRIA